MTLAPLMVAGAVLLDLVLGDPRWFPHPVVAIGTLIKRAEPLLRRIVKNERAAGLLLVVIVVGVSAGTVGLLLRLAGLIHPLAAQAAGMVIGYTCLAARSLHLESAQVAGSLLKGDLVAARASLAMIVGRDTGHLDEPEIWRATVETVAENSSDGVIAPLFFLLIGGPVLAIAYKAVNTLDSMVGYKNDRYLLFGWGAARFDDLCNWVPARLTGVLMVLAAPLVGLSGRNAWRMMRRDGRNHSSPNSGVPEAAAAGALGVRLGGVNRYFGQEVLKPVIGDPLRQLDAAAWQGSVRLMYGAEGVLLVAWLTALAVFGRLA
ncbi:adenosylcobinamide-phosphate synthase CbiB [Geobacter sp. OR-1]|uniref:adenosylcobinamide-phosphate synthase CbiB n=1 Tax=Geobacter sp. OR-1 TaxID=1266765 RepID=UPI0018729565|nr:adenosylcobinamide-phosphate synthase CbiB [Geobacter sp. OR-1]